MGDIFIHTFNTSRRNPNVYLNILSVFFGVSASAAYLVDFWIAVSACQDNPHIQCNFPHHSWQFFFIRISCQTHTHTHITPTTLHTTTQTLIVLCGHYSYPGNVIYIHTSLSLSHVFACMCACKMQLTSMCGSVEQRRRLQESMVDGGEGQWMGDGVKKCVRRRPDPIRSVCDE